jgi:NAD(P)-dependent dehydrogenase (short-subunit alcohol dehydrogenase family)
VSARFTGKSVVVTGAASGIGLATARLLADEGAHVLAVDVDAGVERIGACRSMASALVCDVGDEDAVSHVIAVATERNGTPDVVVANAGVGGGIAGLIDQSAALWTEALRVNLIGPFLAIKYGARAILAAGRPGVIVCTASVAGLRAGGISYSASKGGSSISCRPPRSSFRAPAFVSMPCAPAGRRRA